MSVIRVAFAPLGVSGLLLLVGLTSLAAKPNFGASCTDCHTNVRNVFTLPGTIRTANLGAGVQAVMVGVPGSTLDIPVNVNNKGAGKYAVALRVSRAAGRVNAAHLFTLDRDPAWTSQVGGTYFTSAQLSSNAISTYHLVLPAALAPDSYDLVVSIGGGGEDWGQEQIIHLSVLGPVDLRGLTLLPSGGGVQLSAPIPGIPGIEYVLESSGSPAGPWAATAATVNTGPASLLQHSTTAPLRFYRVLAH